MTPRRAGVRVRSVRAAEGAHAMPPRERVRALRAVRPIAAAVARRPACASKVTTPRRAGRGGSAAAPAEAAKSASPTANRTSGRVRSLPRAVRNVRGVASTTSASSTPRKSYAARVVRLAKRARGIPSAMWRPGRVSPCQTAALAAAVASGMSARSAHRTRRVAWGAACVSTARVERHLRFARLVSAFRSPSVT